MIEVIIFFVFIIKKFLTILLRPRLVFVEFMIEQMVVLGLWNIDFITHMHVLR